MVVEVNITMVVINLHQFKTANLKSAGLDNLRNDHLKQFVGKGVEPRKGEETSLYELLVAVIMIVLADDVPEPVIPLFHDIMLY